MRGNLFFGSLLAHTASVCLETQTARALSLQGHHPHEDEMEISTALMEMENNAEEEATKVSAKEERRLIDKADKRNEQVSDREFFCKLAKFTQKVTNAKKAPSTKGNCCNKACSPHCDDKKECKCPKKPASKVVTIKGKTPKPGPQPKWMWAPGTKPARKKPKKAKKKAWYEKPITEKAFKPQKPHPPKKPA